LAVALLLSSACLLPLAPARTSGAVTPPQETFSSAEWGKLVDNFFEQYFKFYRRTPGRVSSRCMTPTGTWAEAVTSNLRQS